MRISEKPIRAHHRDGREERPCGPWITVLRYSSASVGCYRAHGGGLVLVTLDFWGGRAGHRMEDSEHKLGPSSISASSVISESKRLHSEWIGWWFPSPSGSQVSYSLEPVWNWNCQGNKLQVIFQLIQVDSHKLVNFWDNSHPVACYLCSLFWTFLRSKALKPKEEIVVRFYSNCSLQRLPIQYILLWQMALKDLKDGSRVNNEGLISKWFMQQKNYVLQNTSPYSNFLTIVHAMKRHSCYWVSFSCHPSWLSTSLWILN